MKLGMAAGLMGAITGVKEGRGVGVSWLTQFPNGVIVEGRIRRRMTEGAVPRKRIPPTRRDAPGCFNYGRIELIPHAIKVCERVVDSRQGRWSPSPKWSSWSFMPQGSTTYAIFIAGKVMEKYREKRKPRYLAFIDLEKPLQAAL